MKKKVLFLVVGGVFCIFIGLLFSVYFFHTTYSDVTHSTTTPFVEVLSDPRNITYHINEESFTLVNGTVTKNNPYDSSIRNTVSIFGQPVIGDVDLDSNSDAVVFLSYDNGGSGTFYYVAVAFSVNSGYSSTNTIFLGDRVIPKTIVIHDATITVTYLIRKENESFAMTPTIEKNINLTLGDHKQLIEVSPFEIPVLDEPSLGMKSWTWTQATYTDGTKFVPKKPDAFTITFNNDKTFSATTDCNSLGGSYVVNGNALSFMNVVSTMIFCMDSEEYIFTTLLGTVVSYEITSSNSLKLNLSSGAGFAEFR